MKYALFASVLAFFIMTNADAGYHRHSEIKQALIRIMFFVEQIQITVCKDFGQTCRAKYPVAGGEAEKYAQCFNDYTDLCLMMDPKLLRDAVEKAR